MSEFFELRIYQVFPEKMTEWLELMEKTIIPFQVSKGMIIHGSFTENELLQLIKLTNDETIEGINENLLIEINNYVKSCVDFINYEIKGETEKYFQKFKNNSCFSYEKKIKMYLNSIRL